MTLINQRLTIILVCILMKKILFSQLMEQQRYERSLSQEREQMAGSISKSKKTERSKTQHSRQKSFEETLKAAFREALIESDVRIQQSFKRITDESDRRIEKAIRESQSQMQQYFGKLTQQSQNQMQHQFGKLIQESQERLDHRLERIFSDKGGELICLTPQSNSQLMTLSRSFSSAHQQRYKENAISPQITVKNITQQITAQQQKLEGLITQQNSLNKIPQVTSQQSKNESQMSPQKRRPRFNYLNRKI